MNTVSKSGCTCVYFACEEGHLEGIQMLVEAGVDVNARTKDGCIALQMACQQGSLAVVKYLAGIDGTDIRHKNNGGWTALHEAAHHGRIDVVSETKWNEVERRGTKWRR